MVKSFQKINVLTTSCVIVFKAHIVWVLCWLMLGIMLVHFGNHVGPYYGQCWSMLGSMLGTMLVHVGDRVDPCWGPCWSMLGTMLIHVGDHVGDLVGPCWGPR